MTVLAGGDFHFLEKAAKGSLRSPRCYAKLYIRSKVICARLSPSDWERGER